MTQDEAMPPPISEAEQKQVERLVAELAAATERVEREARHMGRVRLYFGWAGVVMTAAATAALPLNETVTQWVTGVLQMLCWLGVALVNFCGPWAFERWMHWREQRDQ